MRPIKRVSIVVPMWNEAHRVDELVEDIAAQDVGAELEVLVADGRSTDGSVERLRTAAERVGLRLSVLDNPARLVADALNMCVERASGDLIVRLDCKSRYPPDYVRACVRAAEETDAWNVGGVVLPRGSMPKQRAFACAMDSPFGGIHWMREGVPTGRVEVDTVYCGSFRPHVLSTVGRFDPAMGPDHDDEFNLRLRRAGGHVLLDPDIRAYYRLPPSFGEVFAKYYDYGRFKVAVMRKHRTVVSARSLVPLAFVASLASLAPLAARSRLARRALAAEIGAYAGAAFAFGGAAVVRRRESRRLLPVVVATFPTFHVGYGLGMLRGLVDVASPQ